MNYELKKRARGAPNCINKPNYLQSYRECLVLVFAKILQKVFLSIVLRLKGYIFEFYDSFFNVFMLENSTT